MPTTIPTNRVDFLSGGTRCAAWLTLPPGAGPYPAVVLVHGRGATHDMMLAQYEQHFAAAAISSVVNRARIISSAFHSSRKRLIALDKYSVREAI